MYRKFASLVILLSFVSYLVGCTSMRYLSREEISEVEQKSSVWVTTTDGSQFEIKEPKVESSKLVGYVKPEGYKEIDLSEIESLGIKEPDQRKTILLGVMGFSGAFILIWILSDGESDSCST